MIELIRVVPRRKLMTLERLQIALPIVALLLFAGGFWLGGL